MDMEHFRHGMRHRARLAQSTLSDPQLMDLFRAIDIDGRGLVDFPEFEAFAGTHSGCKYPFVTPGIERAEAELHTAAQKEQAKQEDELRHRLQAASYTWRKSDMRKLFALLDRDGNGVLSLPEWIRGARRMKLVRAGRSRVSDAQLTNMFCVISQGEDTMTADNLVHFVGEVTAPHLPGMVLAMEDAHVEGCVKKAAEVEALKTQMRAAAYTKGGIKLRKLFHHIDKDNSGILERNEFVQGVRRNGLVKDGKRAMPDSRLYSFFDAIDTDKSGTISVDEFVAFVGEYKRSDPEAMTKAMAAAEKLAFLEAEAALEALRIQIRAASYTEGGVDVAKFFRYLDKDGNGLLDRAEFLRAVRRAGLVKEGKRSLADHQLLHFFDAIDEDHSETITEEEFVKFVERTETVASKSNRTDLEVLLLEKFYAADADGSGFLDADEFAACLKGIEGLELHDAVIDVLRTAADADGDGQIAYDEFAPAVASLLGAAEVEEDEPEDADYATPRDSSPNTKNDGTAQGVAAEASEDRLPGSRIRARCGTRILLHVERESVTARRRKHRLRSPFKDGHLPGSHMEARICQPVDKDEATGEAAATQKSIRNVAGGDKEDAVAMAVCYVCGNRYTTTSLRQHMTRCLQKRRQVEADLLPPSLHAQLDDITFQFAQCIPIPAGDPMALAQYNAEASAAYQASMPQCPECGRTFVAASLQAHMRGCCPGLADELFSAGMWLRLYDRRSHYVKCPVCRKAFSHQTLSVHLPLCRLNARRATPLQKSIYESPPEPAEGRRSSVATLTTVESEPVTEASDWPEEHDEPNLSDMPSSGEEDSVPLPARAAADVAAEWMGGQSPLRDYQLAQVPEMWQYSLRSDLWKNANRDPRRDPLNPLHMHTARQWLGPVEAEVVRRVLRRAAQVAQVGRQPKGWDLTTVHKEGAMISRFFPDGPLSADIFAHKIRSQARIPIERISDAQLAALYDELLEGPHGATREGLQAWLDQGDYAMPPENSTSQPQAALHVVVHSSAAALVREVIALCRAGCSDDLMYTGGKLSIPELRKASQGTKYHKFISWLDRKLQSDKASQHPATATDDDDDAVRRRIRMCAYSLGGRDLKRFFHYIDREKIGELDEEAFRRGITRCNGWYPVTAQADRQKTNRQLCRFFRRMAKGKRCVDASTFEACVGMGDADAALGQGGSEAMKRVKVSAKQHAAQEISELQRRIRVAAYTLGGSDLSKFFYFLDKRNRGSLSMQEFVQGLRRAKVVGAGSQALADDQLEAIFRGMDPHGAGCITEGQFVAFVKAGSPETKVGDAQTVVRAMRETRYDSRTQTLLGVEAVRLMLRRAHMARADPIDTTGAISLFAMMDCTGSGIMERHNFIYRAQQCCGVNCTEKQLGLFFDTMNKDNSEWVSQQEFEEFLLKPQDAHVEDSVQLAAHQALVSGAAVMQVVEQVRQLILTAAETEEGVDLRTFFNPNPNRRRLSLSLLQYIVYLLSINFSVSLSITLPELFLFYCLHHTLEISAGRSDWCKLG